MNAFQKPEEKIWKATPIPLFRLLWLNA